MHAETRYARLLAPALVLVWGFALDGCAHRDLRTPLPADAHGSAQPPRTSERSAQSESLKQLVAPPSAVPEPAPLSQRDAERRALSAAREGWLEATLPWDQQCPLDRVRVSHADAAQFEQACWVTADRAASCFSWQPSDPPSATATPTVVLSPGFQTDAFGEPVIHELLHLLVACNFKRAPDDPYDGSHTDPRVWKATGGKSSAQARAEAWFARR